MAGALQGMRVVELCHFLAGPLCSMLLGDMGAEVIKIEPPGRGDLYRYTGTVYVNGESSNFLSANRNKLGLTLDLRDERGREVLLRLVDGADVLIENFRPRSAERLGLSYEVLAERNPRLVYCSITGFGRHGPYRERAAVDPIIQAMSGLMSLTGEDEREPVRLGSAVGDLYGALMAVQGILGALVARERGGLGQRVDVSLLDAALFGLIPREGEYFATGEVFPRMGSGHPQFVPFQAFHAADDYLYLAVFHNEYWQRLCRAVGHPELIGDPRYATVQERSANRRELVALLGSILAEAPVEHWLERLEVEGVPCARINNLADVFADPQVTADEMVVELEHPTAGQIKVLDNPIRLSRTPTSVRIPPPTLGQHADQVLASLGYGVDEVAELRRAGIV
ncbi:MAG: CoA transferase [Chloroflexota bacterium]|nr:CoA transferase [Chloroflexota bacterium]